MRSRRSAVDHSEAVARRLALLSAELGVHRPEGEDAVAWAGPTRISGLSWPDEDLDLDPVDDPFSETAGPARSEREANGSEDLSPDATSRVPGRHAARGRSGRWGRLAAVGTVSSRPPGQTAVLLGGVALALVVTCGWLLLGPGASKVVEVEPLAATPTASMTPAGAGEGESEGPSAGSAAAPDEDTQVVVHVAGKVRRPGIVVLPVGARVGDAVERAGGARRGADTSSVNLARVLVDGEQIVVGRRGGATVSGMSTAAPTPASGSATSPTALVNINTADQVQLETLPGVGPVMAGAIISWRTTHGGFSTVGDLLEVKGIGEATLARLTPLITL